MLMPERLKVSDFAPCGIDCAACYARTRKKNSCPGCLSGSSQSKPIHCQRCRIRACAEERGFKRCYRCPDFPCALAKKIDKRYRSSYGLSLVENGKSARETGLRAFMEADRRRWTCPSCGGIINLHWKQCSECGKSLAASGIDGKER